MQKENLKGIKDRKIKLQGQVYDSISDAAKQHNLSPVTLYNRINNPNCGPDSPHLFDERLPRKKSGGQRPFYPHRNSDFHPMTINGITYNSIQDMAKKAGIAPSSMSRRLHRGWPKETILNPKGSSRKPIVINGKSYLSLTEASKELHISVGTLNQRLKKYGPDSHLVVRPIIHHKVEIDGKTFDSTKDAANYIGIKRYSLLERIKHYGYSDPRLGRPYSTIKKGKPIKFFGKEYKSVYNANQAFNLPRGTINNFIYHFGRDFDKWPKDKQEHFKNLIEKHSK